MAGETTGSNIGSGGLGPGSGIGSAGRPVIRAGRIGIDVATKGLSAFASETSKIHQNVKGIREEFEKLNKLGKSSPLSGLGGGGGGGIGGSGGGLAGASDPSASRSRFGAMVSSWSGGSAAGSLLATGIAAGGSMLSGRNARNILESTPIFGQSALMSSMYGQNTMPYLQIERQRLQALGQYAGSRQSAATAQEIALRYGQTPQQANTFLAGLGRQVQASGGTMDVAQAALSGAGFLDPVVMRRQRAMGMQTARVRGQVRDFNTVAQDYIKNFEQRYNGGRKLNEIDFINMMSPGNRLRFSFQRVYGLDEQSIDMIVQVGMQTVQSGGRLDYGSAASIAQFTGNDSSRLPLMAQQLVTSRSRREAQYGARQQDNFVSQMRIDERINQTLGTFEDKLSGVIGVLTDFERVLKGVVTAGGIALAMGGLGMAGGGGLLGAGGLLGRGAAGGVGAGRGVGALFGRGAGGAAGGVGGALGSGGMLARGSAFRIGAGAALAGMGVRSAINSSGVGDIFKTAGWGAAAGAMLGGPWGAAIGGGAGLVAGGIGSLINGANEGKARRQNEHRLSGMNMTDVQLLASIRANNGEYQDLLNPGEGSQMQQSLFDIFQQRRGALIGQFLSSYVTSPEYDKLVNFLVSQYGWRSAAGVNMAWGATQSAFSGMATENAPSNSSWRKYGKRHGPGSGTLGVMDIVQVMQENQHSFPKLRALYKEYFQNAPSPFAPVAITSPAALDIMDSQQWSNAQLANSGNTGDPVSGGRGSGSRWGNQLGDMADVQRSFTDSSWMGLDGRMKQRLTQLFNASGGQVYLGRGGGTRSEAQQRAMFLDRYRPDPNGEVEWQGQKWTRVKGAAAAPPGRSMHEIGLAADLDGPGVRNGWLKANAARFGLKEFSNVNNEPWHVQLNELPNSRREFESSGGTASSGLAGAPMPESTAMVTSGGVAVSGMSGVGYSVKDAINSTKAGSGINFGGTAGMNSAMGAAMGGAMGGAGVVSGGGALSGQQIAQLAYQAGFRGQGLINAVAIAKRESGWNPMSHNTNANTGDNSYGLMQINMLGSLGPARMQQYGISRYEDLFDPLTNLRAAFQLSSGGTDFHHWGGYKGMSDTYNTNINEAAAIVRGLGLGDGEFAHGSGRSVSSGGMSMPPIHITIEARETSSSTAHEIGVALRPVLSNIVAEIATKRN